MIVYVIVSVVMAAVYALLILYFLYGWRKLKERQGHPSIRKPDLPTFTIIVPARNEAGQLPALLDDILGQEYPAALYEVIVVDDFSTDETASVVRRYDNSRVRLIRLKDHMSADEPRTAHKKKAIELGVSNANGTYIITTDADCRMGPQWLFAYATAFLENDPVFISGPVSLFYDGSFLGKFQTLDFLSLVGIGAACIYNGFYNICNGANLAYRKEAFIAVDGYTQADHTPSGDDMMLMHKIGRQFPGRVMFLKNKAAIVSTYTATDFNTFWQQRLRWTSKSTHYEDKRITIILVFAYLFNLSILVNLLLAAFEPVFLRIVMWQFLTKLVIDTLFTYRVTKFFHKENLLWSFLPVQLAHIAYIVCIAPASMLIPYTWKGRRIG